MTYKADYGFRISGLLYGIIERERESDNTSHHIMSCRRRIIRPSEYKQLRCCVGVEVMSSIATLRYNLFLSLLIKATPLGERRKTSRGCSCHDECIKDIYIALKRKKKVYYDGASEI